MMIVRVVDGRVVEFVPELPEPPDDTPPLVYWYNAEFAAQCVNAPVNVKAGWTYDEVTGAFAPPAEPEPPVIPDDIETQIAQLSQQLAALQQALVAQSGGEA